MKASIYFEPVGVWIHVCISISRIHLDTNILLTGSSRHQPILGRIIKIVICVAYSFSMPSIYRTYPTPNRDASLSLPCKCLRHDPTQ